ncbi:MAG: hypothetical protein ACLVDL_05075 [Faecalibacterium prausnitzii]
MTGRLVDMAFTLNGKQRVTLEINGDFREIWDRLHQEPVLDVEIKKHREKRSLSANAYFHVLCNKISAETGESEDAVKRRLVVSYGALARDKDGKPVGLKLPPTVDPSDFYPYVRLYETRQENGKDYSCYVEKEAGKGLSDENFTATLKDKLDGIAAGANKYVHPTHTAAASGLYKTTVDEEGHVTATTPVTKDDITNLGIPAQDTTYGKATAAADGLMAAADKSKMDGMSIATDSEVSEMLAEVYGE